MTKSIKSLIILAIIFNTINLHSQVNNPLDITLQIDTLRIGEKFNFKINESLPQFFKYIVDFSFYTNEGIIVYKLNLDSSNNFSNSFTVPKNSQILEIRIMNLNTENFTSPKNMKYLVYPIYDKKIPALNSYAQLMVFYSMDGNTLKNSFEDCQTIDSINYPNYSNRYLYKWEVLKRNKKIIKREYDSIISIDISQLTNVYKKNKDNYSFYEKINYFSVCALGYAIIKDNNNCHSMLDTIINKLSENAGNYDSDQLLFRDNLTEISNMIYKNNGIDKTKNEFYQNSDKNLDVISSNIFSQIFNIAYISKSTALLLELGRRYYDVNFFEKHKDGMTNYIDELNEKIKKLKKRDLSNNPNDVNSPLCSRVDPIFSLADFYRNLKFYDRSIEFYKIAIEYYDKFDVNKISKNLNDGVYYTPGVIGMKACAYRYLGEALIKANKEEEGLDTLKKLCIYFEPKIYNIGSMKRAAEILFDNYLKKEDINSVEYYLSKAYEFQSQLTDTLIRRYNALREKKNLTYIDKDSIVSKYQLKLISFENSPIKTFDSDKRTFDFSALKDTALFIFNIRDDCASCNVALPMILDKLLHYQDVGKCYVVIVSDIPLKALQKVFGEKVHYTKRDNSIKLLLKPIRNYPMYHAVIKNSKYITDESLNTDIEFYKQYMN